ncbi:MAG TPA: helix-turn-helix domain-containing protein [Flavobacteriales bacterium]|nr:helix-turn-helix domain-containing protein [Flavobacteriales bacterium]
MATILTSFTEEEFRTLLKSIVSEVLTGLNGDTKPSSEPMDIQEAAKFLKLEVNTIYEKTSKRLIPHSKKGNKLYFDKQELTEWVKSGKIRTQDEIQSTAQVYNLYNRHKKAS